VDGRLFSGKRCPLPPARSFSSSVVLMNAAISRPSKSEDSMVGCRSHLHLALEVSFLPRHFEPVVPHTLCAKFAITGQVSKSGTRTPLREYNARWSQELKCLPTNWQNN
jgi:hypothetical protein